MLKTPLKPNNVRHQENKIGQGFQIATPKQFFSVGIGVGDRSRDGDVTVVLSTLVSIRDPAKIMSMFRTVSSRLLRQHKVT